MITVKATRNTYDSKNDLRDCGFVWNKEDKVWEKEFDSMESYNEFMDHFMNVTYWGCKIVNRFHSKVVFEIIEEEVVEENEEVETEKSNDTISEVEERISSLSDDNCEVSVINEIKLDRAKMYIYKFNDCLEASAIIYDDGALFHLRGWQGGCPHSAEEIEDYDWITEDGQMAVILDGMPKILK